MNPAAIARGLITYANLELYQKAEVKFPPPANYVPPKEPIAVQLLENVLNKVIFKEEKYSTVFVNSQIPPHENSDLACDLAIRYVTKNMDIWTMCFIEAKRTRNRETTITRFVEEDALKYCKEYFFGNPSNNSSFVYAGTLIGTRLRLWRVQRTEREEDMKLTPLWGSEDIGSDEDYKDLGNNLDGPEIMKTFHDMLEVPPKPWFNASPTAVTPSPQSGAYQLPPPGRDKPMLLTNPTLPPTGQVPGDYKWVSRFINTRGPKFSWNLGSQMVHTGRAEDWNVREGNYVNSKQKVYADHNTENLPVLL
ncbi:hypothetical protein AnigIFM63604_004644 [Aspergillus niger]|uniref:Uncharacterized protein n=2 Tax=Aspergillus TaxID=5052 RepID=A0A370PJP6_ASPPH|nr:hypothetical protein CBS147371_6208 [Aspergillus niger]RDK42406.1 hypothetical protein M752DRAFT_300619 [Aspergillus phoenicis ATCC 13157]GLA49040.1 hypothetical protein AnigIFM63604_004644 [Aspergillus niger]